MTVMCLWGDSSDRKDGSWGTYLVVKWLKLPQAPNAGGRV